MTDGDIFIAFGIYFTGSVWHMEGWPQATWDVALGDMTVWAVGHSGWVVETRWGDVWGDGGVGAVGTWMWCLGTWSVVLGDTRGGTGGHQW